VAVEIILGGVNVSEKRLANGALTWNDQLNGRGTLGISFFAPTVSAMLLESGGRLLTEEGMALLLEESNWRPEDGQELLVVQDDPAEVLTADGAQIRSADLANLLSGPERLFGGILQEPQEWEEPATDTLFFECAAVEFSSICDRHIVTRIYEQQTVDDIVRDIASRDLLGEGILTAGVVAGPLIEKAVFPDVTVTDALNQLAELTGYAWRVDQYKVLHFRPRTSLVAPMAFDGDTMLAGSIRVRRDRQMYRNTQIVRAGTDLTDPRSEVLVGDGQRKVFATAFPLGSVPTVEESRGGAAFAAKTVGILGVERDRDWYWNAGQAQVSQDDAGAVLAAPTTPSNPATGDRIRVTYRGIFPVKTQYTDLGEIASRKAIEGGSGVYMAVEDRPEMNSAASALDTAIALIERYGKVGTVVEGKTRAGVLEPGQVITVNLPRHGIVGQEMLIDSIAAEFNSEVGEVWYSLTAMSGDPFGGWQNYFRKLIAGGRSLVIGREGEVLVLTRAMAEGVACSAVLGSPQSIAPESRIGIMAVGTGEIGAEA
jgi:hypothetical protein